MTQFKSASVTGSKLPPLTYARTAKRVDVKKLKENIWSLIPTNTQQASEPPIKSTEGPEKSFKDVISGLSGLYPEQTFKDISVAYCFICTLHLANEQGLDIVANQDLSDFAIKS